MIFKAKDISVLIPTYNRPEPLKECLESITNQTKLPFEVIVVDASENMESKQVVDKYFGLGFDIQYYSTKPDKIEQRNFGTSKANGKLIQLSDDDIVFDSKYFEYVETYLQEINDNIFGGFIGSIFETYFINSEKNILSKIKHQLSKLFQKFFMIYPLGNGNIMKSAQHQLILNEEKGDRYRQIYVMGGAGGYLKDIFHVAKFDPIFKGYASGEDIDLSLKVSMKYHLYYFPKAKVMHKHIGNYNRTMSQKLFDRGRLLRFFYLRYRRYYNLSLIAHLWAMLGLVLFALLFKGDIKNSFFILKSIFSFNYNKASNKS